MYHYLRLLPLLLLLAACTSGPGPWQRQTGEPYRTIYVMAGGWHTNITVEAEAVRPWLHPSLQQDFPRARYLRFGWGDGDYYPATAPSNGMAIRSLFASRYPVMRVIGDIKAPSPGSGPWDTVKLRVRERDLPALARFLNDSLTLDAHGQPLREADFQRDINAYYRSSGHYGAFYTCNTWTLEALQAAGLPVDSRLHLTRDSVMRQLRTLEARQINESSATAAILQGNSRQELHHDNDEHSRPLATGAVAAMAESAPRAHAPGGAHP